MWNSEAQAYQAIRREWKQKRNEAQRKQNYYMWQVENREVHPKIIREVSRIMGVDLKTMPVDRNAAALMQDYQDLVSDYSLLLNKYKVDPQT